MSWRVVVLSLVTAGCHGGDGLEHGVDAAPVAPDSPTGFSTAPHTALPIAIAHAGVLLDHPKLVTITYGDYTAKTQVKAWADAVATSTWWTAVGAEYGIGAMTHAASFELGNAPTTVIEDTDVEAQIQALITAHSVPTPPATGNEYLYMIFIPPTVQRGASLQDLFGYHASAKHGTATFPYAVIVDDGSGLDTTTSTASHELIEAATNPYVPPKDGWYVDPPLPDPWYLILGEVGDLCSFEPSTHEGAFAYQRSWSNVAAAAGANPCVPNEGDEWDNVTASPATMPTIPKGGSATFTLTGWSTQEIADWKLDYGDADYSDLTSGAMAPEFSSDTINNGRSVTVTLHAPATAASGKLGGIYILSGDYARPWAVGFVVQ